MLRAPHQRLTTTLIVVLSLLFSQLALASYVCPGQADRAAMAEMMASGFPCEGMDADQPALCAEFSAGTPQTFEPVKLPAASPPMLVLVLEMPVALDSDLFSAVPPTATPEAQPPPDPLFLSTLRLRV